MFASTKKTALLIALTAVMAGAAGGAFAQDTKADWKKDHPRRVEVNKRLNNQNKRVKDEVKEGDMSKAQAKQIHKEDHKIRQQERRMAAKNDGHLTKAEQKKLNVEENQVSKQIGK